MVQVFRILTGVAVASLLAGTAGARPVDATPGVILEIGGGGGNRGMAFSKEPYINQDTVFGSTDFSLSQVDLAFTDVTETASGLIVGLGYGWPRFGAQVLLGIRSVTLDWKEMALSTGTHKKDMEAEGSGLAWGARLEGTPWRGERFSLDLALFGVGMVDRKARLYETLLATGVRQEYAADNPNINYSAALVAIDAGIELTASYRFGNWIPWASIGSRAETAYFGFSQDFPVGVTRYNWELKDFTLEGSSTANPAVGVDWLLSGHGLARLEADLANPSGVWFSVTFRSGIRGNRKAEGKPTEADPAAAPAASAAPARSPEERANVAVAELDPRNVSAGEASVVADWLRTELIKTDAFNVIERQSMEKIFAEQGLQQTGCTNSECAVKLGKILNVKSMVVGSYGKLMDSYVVNIRVIDVESGKGVYADTAKGDTVDEVGQAVRDLASRMARGVK